jgi:phospholipid/cholesterol/gamma-HCH transport system substrate-binding protein
MLISIALGSRIRPLLVGLIGALIAALCLASCGGKQQSLATQYCADLSDSIGLYVGNAVTQMGYKIGVVDSITSHDTGVEVRFTVNGNRPLSSDVKAVIRSTSILADRSLELVGKDAAGTRLAPGQCIARDRTATPLSISQVIGSATNFVNGINPAESTNIKDALRDVDAALNGNGQGLKKLLTTSSAMLDNPDQGIADLGSIVRNMVQLSEMLKASRPPLKRILLDMPDTTPNLVNLGRGTAGLTDPVGELIRLVNDLELNLGDDIQTTLDTVSDALRHLSPHYKGIANILNPVPRFINTISYYVNNHQFDLIGWSPTVFRIRTPDGLALCGVMNASMPGSCADVNGQPHAVDVALLQYVLMEAARK